MKMRTALTPALMCLLPSSALLAQDPAGACREIFRMPEVGAYSELHFSAADSDDLEIRFAVVGAEAVEGANHYWMEIAAARVADGEQLITQLLVPGYPFDVRDVKGYVLKLPDQPATRMPRQMIERMGASTTEEMAWEKACAEAEDLGTADVSVAAGSFTARQFRTHDEAGVQGEVWLVRTVPFAMVLMDHPEGKMELIRYGMDATSLITEEPVEFKMPMAPPNEP